MTTCFLLLATILPAAWLSWWAVGRIRDWAPRWGLLDRPNQRKVHSQPIPLGGGLGIWFAVVSTFAIGTAVVWLCGATPALRGLLPSSIAIHLDGLLAKLPELWGMLVAGTLLALLGLWDDWRGLPWQVRLVAEFTIAGLSAWLLGYRLTAFIPLALLGWCLAVLWIVTLINAFNMLDNMDGLSGGVATIASLSLAVAMLLPNLEENRPQLFVAALLFVLVGALLGFLWHNRPPARIFMGDSGAYFIGFVVAVATLLATYAGYRAGNRHAVLVPICALAVPLYDLGTVLWIRLREGRSPFQADKRHFSHRLVDLGLSKPQAVLTIYLVAATCGLAALLLTQVSSLGACLVVGIVLCMLTLIAILESRGWPDEPT
jgi:UDP-GlcNAc:undecaprenyl-phosphate GlcNAc-1-phosphate transferase